jgi:pantetheine-phosphate adenylyltransferase
MPHEKYTYLNSTIIRNLAMFGGEVNQFVPPIVQQKLKERFHEKYAARNNQNNRENDEKFNQ